MIYYLLNEGSSLIINKKKKIATIGKSMDVIYVFFFLGILK